VRKLLKRDWNSGGVSGGMIIINDPNLECIIIVLSK